MAAQGLGRSAVRGQVRQHHLDRVLEAVAVLQIDSVNVLVRSHYLPVFSRLGPYPRHLLDRAAGRHPRRLVEYWAHQASYTDPRTHALLTFRMARARQEAWAGLRRTASELPHLLEDVRAVVAGQGPLTSAAIEQTLGQTLPAPRAEWGWNWSHVKMAIEFLFRAGELASAGRTTRFERLYDLPERVLPPLPAGAGEPASEADACRELVAIAARAHGVGTEACLRDYFRMTAVQSRRAVAELVEAGRLLEVRVQGWRRPAYLDPQARMPERIGGSALLSPFDSLVWFRPRTEALFAFRYRIGIYTPAAERTHGYYVLPYLLGDRLVARVDVQADRAARVLGVPAAWLESPEARGRSQPDRIARSLAADLLSLAGWLGLDDVRVAPRGDLAEDLGRALVTARRVGTVDRVTSA